MLTTATKISYFLLFLLVSYNTEAQTWTGKANSNWNTPENWNTSAVPSTNSEVNIPGEGIANWPIISNNIVLKGFSVGVGGKIDTKGYTINVQRLSLWGGTINNTATGTNIKFLCNGNVLRESHLISNTTFNGNTEITFSGDYNFEEGFESTYFPTMGTNVYNGNTKFILTGKGSFRISYNEPSVFKGNLEIERFENIGNAYLFNNGTTTVAGNFKYTDKLGGDIHIGNYASCNVKGKVDISVKLPTDVNRSFYLTNLTNEIAGGKVETENIGFFASGNKLKISKLEVKKPYYPITFVNNTIEGNVDMETYGDSEIPSNLFGNKVTGDFDFLHQGGGILYESSSEYGKNVPANEFLGNVSILKGYIYAGPIKIADGQNAPRFAKNLTLSGNNTSIGPVGVIFNGESNSTLQQLTNALTIPKLKIEKTGNAKLTLSSPVSVSNTLSFVNGDIVSTTSNPLIFLDGATSSGASDNSHVTGPIQKIGNDPFTFPIGSGTKLDGVSINAPSNVNDKFSAEYVSSNPSGSGYNTNSRATSLTKIYDTGFWEVKRMSGSSNVKVSLCYNMSAGNITDQSKLRVAHWNGSIWEDLGNGGTSGSLTTGTVSTASSVSSFSPFSLASIDNSNPLPVKLARFSVQKENTTALLQWTTTEEINSDRFEIEHSLNAKNWQKLSEVKAVGKSNSSTNYDYAHINPLKGLNYYRLKMIDADGTFAYSQIENVQIDNGIQTTIYPNPVSDKLFVETANGVSAFKAELMSITGTNVLSANASDFRAGIDLSKLSAGFYFVNITLLNGHKETHKVFVTR